MLSWVRGSQARGADGHRSGVTIAPDVPVQIDESLKSKFGDPDAAWLLNSLQTYATAYKKQLHGQGLVVRAGQALPPPAFRIIPRASLSEFRHFLHADDYVDRDAAARALNQVELREDEAQLAWMINAILVRAALDMAPFALGTVRLDLAEAAEGRGPRVVYSLGGEEHAVHSSRLTNPVALHRQMHAMVLTRWSTALANAEVAVIEETLEALSKFNYSAAMLQWIDQLIRRQLEDSTILLRMRTSGAAFIDGSKLAEVCEAFVSGIDRTAIRHALRHGNAALNWSSYTAHLDRELQAAALAAEPHGCLAYGRYPADILSRLYSLHQNAPLPFKTWRGQYDNFGYTGDFTAAFLQSLEAQAGDKLLTELRSLSPRFLCGLVTGYDNTSPLEISYQAAMKDAWGCGDAITTAERAGRVLAMSLNKVLEGKAGCSPKLPWARVLSHDSAQAILLRPMEEGAAVDALTALFGYANTLRSKKQRLAASIDDLPTAEALVAAPRANALGSLVAMNKEHIPGGWPAAQRAALALAVEMGGGTSGYQTRSGALSGRTEQWQVAMGAPRVMDQADAKHTGGVRLALRDPGRHRHAWTLISVTASTSDTFATTKDEELAVEHNRFALRGAGTPDSVAPLVFQVRIAHNSRAMTFSRAPSQNPAYVNLNLCPVAQDAPKHALRMRDSDDASVRRDALGEHYQLLMSQVRARVTKAVVQRPYHAACAYPAVALFLWKGGKLAEGAKLRPLGAATAFRLARACVGMENPLGMGYLCREAASPTARTNRGISLLDVALESLDYRLAQGAMEGLASNPRLGKSELAGLVQSSFGKLIERHPELLQHALRSGAKVDQAARAAWDRLHPDRLMPELSQTFEAAAMQAAIGDCPESAASTESPRRRMRVV